MNATHSLARLKQIHLLWIFFGAAALLPLIDFALPRDWKIGDLVRPIFIFAILGIGLNVLVGYTGLLNLGVAAFMAIGVYTYAIATCEMYPFQVGFWWGCALAIIAGGTAGLVLGLPTMRLRGDYLAIVTLGFGEITQDALKNLDVITKGTQGINPLPTHPNLFGSIFGADAHQPSYYLLLGALSLVVVFTRNLERSRIGRAWISIREDELAAAAMGVNPIKTKLLAFVISAAFCALAGALWASFLGTSGEPSNYDFQVSMITLCIVIVGGMGSLSGVLLGALVIIGFNAIFLAKVSTLLTKFGVNSTASVYSSPNNWKYFVFGLALVFMMRFKPEGLLPSRQLKAELHSKEEDKS